MYRAVVELVGQSTWSRRWEGLALMIPEGPLVCDDALGARSTSSFELCKPGDRRNVFRFSRRSPHRQEARRQFPGRFLLLGSPPWRAASGRANAVSRCFTNCAEPSGRPLCVLCRIASLSRSNSVAARNSRHSVSEEHTSEL